MVDALAGGIGEQERGGLRPHFTHVIDVAPTILDIAAIPQPNTVDGIEQEPMHGFTFRRLSGDAAAPRSHTQQYFRRPSAIAPMYKDGWWLAMKTERIRGSSRRRP